MIVHVHPLNADSTFLISVTDEELGRPVFSVVIDPWLFGDSPAFHPSLANQSHSIPAHIDSLTWLEPGPDAVFVSQNKADHCHKGTLLELPASTKIYAVKDAHDTIRSWDHFQNLEVISDYRATKKENILKFPGGELALCNLPATGMHGITGLHNALSIRITKDGSASKDRLQIVYSCHGVPASALEPLLPLGSKIDLLLHPCTRVAMPFWLGGDVSLGYRGIHWLVEAFKVGNVVGSHDEPKIISGFVKFFVNYVDSKDALPEGTRLWEMSPAGWRFATKGEETEASQLGGDWQCCGKAGGDKSEGSTEKAAASDGSAVGGAIAVV